MRCWIATTCMLVAACHAEPLERFESEVAIAIIDTDGVEMGQEDFSVHSDRFEDAALKLWPVDGFVADTDNPPAYDGCAAIRVRGSSSRAYDKRSFRLELRTKSGADLDARLLDMTSDADWVLSGPYSDKSLIRNALIYQLSRDIGRWAPRTEPVELFIVDDPRDWSMDHYRGLYWVTERIERHSHRVDVARLGPEDGERKISGGYIFQRDWIEGEEQSSLLTTPVYDDTLIVEYPRELTQPQRTFLEGWFDDFEQSLSSEQFDEEDGGYRDFVDIDSFVDHMLLVELGRTVDGYVLSTWMHKQRNGPLQMGPIWDYNGALGNADYFEAWRTDGWHFENPEFPEDNPNGFDWYERMLDDPAFRQRIADRWTEHRQGPWSDDALAERIDELVAKLGSAPVERNFERWDGLGTYIWPNDDGAESRATHGEEVDYLREWLIDRANWIDDAAEELADD